MNYHTVYTRYNGLSFDEAYQRWKVERPTITDKEEKRFWKMIFFTRTYGMSKEKLKEFLDQNLRK